MLERNRSQSKFDQSGDYCAVGAWGGLQMPRLGSSQRKNTLLNMNWGKSKFLGYYTNIFMKACKCLGGEAVKRKILLKIGIEGNSKMMG